MTVTGLPDGTFSPTPRQLDCLRVIAEWLDRYGHAPSFREIADELEERNTSGVSRMVHGLVERGWLTMRHAAPRSIQLLHRPPMPDFTEIEWSLDPALAGGGQGGRHA